MTIHKNLRSDPHQTDSPGCSFVPSPSPKRSKTGSTSTSDLTIATERLSGCSHWERPGPMSAKARSHGSCWLIRKATSSASSTLVLRTDGAWCLISRAHRRTAGITHEVDHIAWDHHIG